MNEEKREELRNDYLYEERLRNDYDFLLEEIIAKYNLIDNIENAISDIEDKGYSISSKEFLDILREFI